jgi:hypothetical protein
MSFQLQVGSEWRIYFKNDDTGSVDWVTSVDGYNYTYGGTAINENALHPPCSNGTGFDGSGVFFNSADGNYYAMEEVPVQGGTTCPPNVFPFPYILWLFKNTVMGDPDTFLPAANVPLESLATSNLYAGGRANIRATSGNWYTFPHEGYPGTFISVGKSNDLYNWKMYPQPIVTPTATMFGLTDCNQVADASIIAWNGSLILMYDATDNVNDTGAIGYSKYIGSIDDLDACLNPSPTPTPNWTATPSPTPYTPTVTPTACLFRFTGTIYLEGILDKACCTQ